MGGGGGGDAEIKETEDQKAAAQIAAEQWKIYQSQYVPAEKQYIQQALSRNDASQYAKVAGQAANANTLAYSPVAQAVAGQFAAKGIDPTSGRYQTGMHRAYLDMAKSGADTVNRAQVSNQDTYIQGLQNVTALGQGQATNAVAGFNDIAAQSGSYASQNAQNSYQRYSDNMQALTTVAGAAGRYALEPNKGG